MATTSKMLYFLLFVSLVLNCFTGFRSDAQLLPENEVQTLETISEKLQVKHLNISRSFCSSGRFLNVTVPSKICINVTCNCNDTVCHVTNIQLKGQNCSRILPSEFANLSFLQEMALLGNCINVSIPKEIGDIATLEEV